MSKEKEYHQQLYTNKLNSKEMNKSPQKQLKTDTKQHRNLSTPITNQRNTFIITNVSTKKTPRLNCFTGKFYQALIKET